MEKNGKYEIIFYTVGKEILPHIDNICDAFYKYHSKYLTASWDSNFSQAIKNKTPFTFEDFVNCVWEPVINDCSTFMESLKSKNVKLVDLNTKLRGKYGNENALTDDLRNVNNVLQKCDNKEYDSTWIQEVSIHIHKYWKLCTYTAIGKTTLDQVRTNLQLTGNFHGLEIIATMEVMYDWLL